jgi:hypothetical protein
MTMIAARTWEGDELVAAAVPIAGDAAPGPNVVQEACRLSRQSGAVDRTAGSASFRRRGHDVMLAGPG